jgi:hypothetical protein
LPHRFCRAGLQEGCHCVISSVVGVAPDPRSSLTSGSRKKPTIMVDAIGCPGGLSPLSAPPQGRSTSTHSRSPQLPLLSSRSVSPLPLPAHSTLALQSGEGRKDLRLEAGVAQSLLLILRFVCCAVGSRWAEPFFRF